MIYQSHRLLVLLALLTLLLPSTLAAQSSKGTERPPTPGTGGDAVLPAGYRGVVWGASAKALMAIRVPMQVMHPPNRHITQLIEEPPIGADSDGIYREWKLWDDKLIEVKILFPGKFTLREGRELRERFEAQYGKGKLKKIKKGVETGTSVWDVKVEEQVVEQRWIWQDPFTIQELRNDVRKGQWRMVRQSRMFEASRQAQDEAERKTTQSKRVKSIELD